MINTISSLYPQYKPSEDRRKQNIPVVIERRSGKDRRSEDRVALDSRLTRDIYQVKEHVAKIESLAPKMFTINTTSQAPKFADKNNLTQDQLVKSTKQDISEILREEAELQKKADTSFKIGVITAALAGTIAVSVMGTAGIVIAVGSAVYIGAKVIKATMDKELKDVDNDRKD